MGKTLFQGEKRVIHIKRDCSVNPLPIGATVLENLPDGFIIQSLSVKTSLDSAGGAFPTSGRTLVLGEDGGGDADGYSTDIVAGATSNGKVQRGAGALLYDATDKEPLESFVDPAKDGLTATVATAAVSAGLLDIYVDGYQS